MRKLQMLHSNHKKVANNHPDTYVCTYYLAFWIIKQGACIKDYICIFRLLVFVRPTVAQCWESEKLKIGLYMYHDKVFFICQRLILQIHTATRRQIHTIMPEILTGQYRVFVRSWDQKFGGRGLSPSCSPLRYHLAGVSTIDTVPSYMEMSMVPSDQSLY